MRFGNRSADRLLSRGDAIDARGGRLRARRARDTDALHTLIGRAAETAIGVDVVAVDAVALPSAGEYSSLAVVAEPLAPDAPRQAGAVRIHADVAALLAAFENVPPNG